MADPARARKIADRIQELIAANLQQIVKDPDLGFVTITDVRVTGDLQHASVFYTVLGTDEDRTVAAEVLEDYRGRLRSFVGKGLGIRLTPSLEFILDALPEDAQHMDDLLRKVAERDAEPREDVEAWLARGTSHEDHDSSDTEGSDTTEDAGSTDHEDH